MPLQSDQVLEWGDTVEFCGVDERHKNITHARTVEGFVKQRVASVKDRPLHRSFTHVVVYALQRRTGSVGGMPTRPLSLRPEAPGADQEVTNGLKYSRNVL